MDLVTVELGITIGTTSGGNGRQREAMDWVTFALHTTTETGAPGNAGGNGFGNFRAAHYHWDRLGRQRGRQWIW